MSPLKFQSMIGAPGLLLPPSFLYQRHPSLYSFIPYTEHSHLLHNIQLPYYYSNLKYSCTNSQLSNGHLQKSIGKCHAQHEDNKCDTSESRFVLDVQTLKSFPVEKLDGEFVMLRFDSITLLELLNIHNAFGNGTLSTIRYLYNAGAKVSLVSNWGRSGDPTVLSVEAVAGHLSSLLQLNVVAAKTVPCYMEIKSEKFQKADILLFENLTLFREELANCGVFSEKLASGASIFVNDAFFLSHKILASTVGVARFCYARLAGFHFEDQLLQLKQIREITMQPYLAIIGGGKFLEKAAALLRLASVCDGLIFVGMLAFQVMHASGISVPSCFLEHDAFGEAADLIELANSRKILIYFPTDLWCVNDNNSELFEIFSSKRLLPGWTPIDLGPMALKEINNFLSVCKKVLWIGPVKFASSANGAVGASDLGRMLEIICKNGCDLTVVGNAACQTVLEAKISVSQCKMFENASVVWDFLKGKALPGVAALDRAYPYEIDWATTYENPTQPLVVDIGSGNGLFPLKMAEKRNDLNFLGLEINNKLVMHCNDVMLNCNRKNVHFISTNATSTFRSIVSTYPGELFLVSIQCPNPDFNREGHRWRMVQRALVEAIIDLLAVDAKVFLQSDIEAVSIRMKEQFIKYGKGRIVKDEDDEDKIWLPENPFGVRSDWEQHAVDRGDFMYRMMLRKVGNP
ncbi:hypothetical protein KFK09_017702 [Dendrobium nobile]|uniref:Phosphoglycerate kinase n=1 Tax=Dendrobium nobile TaxID=94219 RepID=A0A8T3ATS5_DENNO|nr:hypothetical protein KFK09_017702 [Dendrobium nobile]